MRKLLVSLVLVPLAAITVLSCDDHPTAAEATQAATTVAESSTALAAKSAPLPKPVALSGAVYVNSYNSCSGPYCSAQVDCPAGKIPIVGGQGPNAVDGWNLFVARPHISIDGTASWLASGRRTDGGTGGWEVHAFAICVDADIEVE